MLFLACSVQPEWEVNLTVSCLTVENIYSFVLLFLQTQLKNYFYNTYIFLNTFSKDCSSNMSILVDILIFLYYWITV